MYSCDKGGWLLFALLILSAVPVGHAAVSTAAQEEGYHQPLYTDKIVSAGTSTSLVLNQSAYEFDNGKAILTTDAGVTELFSASQPIVFQTSLTKINGEALFDDADQVAEFRGSSGNAFVRFNDTTQSTNVGQYDNSGDPYFFIDQEYVPGFGSLVIDDQGRVGLNTTTPSAGLEVRGSAYISGGNPLYFDTGTGVTQFVPTIIGSGNNYSVPTTSAVGVEIKRLNETILDVNQSATQTIAEVLSEGSIANDSQVVGIDQVRARDGDGLLLSDDASNLGVFVDDSGNVGVGTTSPGEALSVVGNTVFDGTAAFDTGTGITQFVRTITGDGNNYSVPTTSAVGGEIDNLNNTITEVNNSATQNIAEVLSEGSIANDSQVVGIDQVRARDGDGLLLSNDANNPGVFVDDNGNVGVGTTSPSSGAEVQGSAYISGGNPLYFDTGTGVTQFVKTINSDGNNYSVPTTSAVTSDVNKKIEDVNLSAGTAIRIDGSNNVDVKRGSGIGVSSDQLYVGAGSGLLQNSGGLAVDSPTCTGSNEALRWDGNSFTCANVDDDTTYGAGEAVNIDGSNNIDVKRGSGISLSGDQLDVAGGQGLIQASGGLEIDAPGPCDAGKEALQWNGSNFICSTVGGSSQDLGTPADSPDGPTEISITGGLNASFVDTSAQQKCSGKYEYLAGDGTCRSDRVGGNLLFAGSAAASRSLLVQEDHTNVDGDEGDGNDHTVRCKADGNPIAITTLRVFGNDYLAGPLEAMCSKVYNTTFERGLTSTVNSASGDEDDARCDGASSVSPEVLTEVEMTQAGSYDALNAKCVEVADSVQLGKEKWTRASDNNGPDGVQITRKCPDGHVMTAVEVNDGQDDNGELDQGVDIRCTELYSDENVVLEYMSEQAPDGCDAPGCDMEAYISNAGASNSFELDVTFTANYIATTLGRSPDCTTTTKSETRSVTVPADGDVIPQASFPQSAFGDDGTTCDLNTISTTVSNPNIGTKSCSASQYDLDRRSRYC